MNFIAVIQRKIVALILGILAMGKRMLCFLNIRRRRRDSGAILPMTVNGILPVNEIQQSLPTNDPNELEMEDWNAWDTDPRPSQGGSHQQTFPNHHPSLNKQFEPEEEEQLDFFTDMTPNITRPKKILLKKKEDLHHEQFSGSSRLAMAPAVIAPVGSELESWEDTGDNAWAGEAEEDLSWQADQTIREKKRLERESRQQEQLKKKQQRDQGRNVKRGPLTAVKLS